MLFFVAGAVGYTSVSHQFLIHATWHVFGDGKVGLPDRK